MGSGLEVSWQHALSSPEQSASPEGTGSPASVWSSYLKRLAEEHRCSKHPLFAFLDSQHLTASQTTSFLRNYDAHASVLRRLLLKAATLMPEEAVGFVVENVRNEYGNGNADDRHQLQLIDLARKAGATATSFRRAKITSGIRAFIQQATQLYYPVGKRWPERLFRPAIAAGAITATELLAIREFQFIQRAFARLGLESHIWLNHVIIEAEHTDESLSLALYFIERHGALAAVEFGMMRLLEANMDLYAGLLSALVS